MEKIFLKKNILFNGNIIDKFILDIDGFYYRSGEKGYEASYYLRWLADLLNEINAPYEKEIEEYFKNHE